MTRFGFGARNSGPSSAIGEGLNVQTDENKSVEELKAQGAQFLEIYIDGRSYPGIYVGTTHDGAHIIQPAPFPNGDAYFDKDAIQKDKYVWQDLSTYNYGRIDGFRQLNRATLEACASGFEKVAHLGSYIGDPVDSDQAGDSVSSDQAGDTQGD